MVGTAQERLCPPYDQCFTTLHLVTTASLITPGSCAQATSSTFIETCLPISPFSCAAWASLLVTIWNVSGPVSRLHSPFGGGSRRGSLTSWNVLTRLPFLPPRNRIA